MTPVSGTNSYTLCQILGVFQLLLGNQIQQSYIELLNQKAIFHFDFSDTNSHIGQTVNDLSEIIIRTNSLL